MRVAIVVAVCLGVLGAGASSAWAVQEQRTAFTCLGEAQWQITWDFGGSSYADLTYSPFQGCKTERATVYENGDFSVSSLHENYPGWTGRALLEGAGVTGGAVFVGTANWMGFGPVVIANGGLSADLSGVKLSDPDGTHGTIVHYPNGSCGTNCYKTKVVFHGAHAA